MNRVYTCIYRKGGKSCVADVVCHADSAAAFDEATKLLELRGRDKIFAMVPGQHSSYTLLPPVPDRKPAVSTADLDARDRVPAHPLNEGFKDYIPSGF